MTSDMSAILTTPLQAECVGEPANKGQRINLCASGPFHGGKILKPEQEACQKAAWARHHPETIATVPRDRVGTR